MSHIKIENNSVAPIESFTVLGLSTARENDAAIGQFGSGTKHAIMLLLRNGIKPIICCGLDKIKFYTKSAMMVDAQGNKKPYQQVWYSHKTKDVQTSCCLDYGCQDWDNVNMALREFVSNAIDQSVYDADGVWGVDIVDDNKVRCAKGTTRIYIPVTESTQRAYDELPENFLHFAGKASATLIPKKEAGPARIYRKGVFIRQVSSYYYDSLFDYNFGDELPIDESRNLSDYQCFQAAGKTISASVQAVTAILKASLNNDKCWEHQIPDYYYYAEDNSDVWQTAWDNVCGDSVLAETKHAAERAERKGFVATVVGCESLASQFNRVVKTTDAELSPIEQLGYCECDATPNALNIASRVWHGLVDLGMVDGAKKQPEVKCFRKTLDAGTKLGGFYKDGTVYINVENDDSPKIMLEEIGHYITGSHDETRDFQDFAFAVAGNLFDLVFDK